MIEGAQPVDVNPIINQILMGGNGGTVAVLLLLTIFQFFIIYTLYKRTSSVIDEQLKAFERMNDNYIEVIKSSETVLNELGKQIFEIGLITKNRGDK
jgi:hypothetical protein